MANSKPTSTGNINQHPPSIILNQKSQSKLTYLHFHTENTHNIKKNLSQTQTNSEKHNPKALILSVTLTQKKKHSNYSLKNPLLVLLKVFSFPHMGGLLGKSHQTLCKKMLVYKVPILFIDEQRVPITFSIRNFSSTPRKPFLIPIL